jgi:hypothetical protein
MLAGRVVDLGIENVPDDAPLNLADVTSDFDVCAVECPARRGVKADSVISQRAIR